MADKKEDYSVVAYIFGIVSIVMAFFNPAAGIVFSIVGLVQSKRHRGELSARAKKLSTIGLILGIILLIVSIIVSIYFAKGQLASLANFPTG